MSNTLWEWSWGNRWITFSDENQRILDARELEPSLSPLHLTEGHGKDRATIRGHPEASHFRTMDLTILDMTMRTNIRRARASDDIPFFAIVTSHSALPLPYDVGAHLFEKKKQRWMPRTEKTSCHTGGRHFVADEGRLYEVHGQGIHEIVWRQQDLTRDEYRYATRQPLCWEFKPNFRWERMLHAIQTVNDPILTQALQTFSPAQPVHATTHGPIQFQDMIREQWLTENDATRKQQLGRALERLEHVYEQLSDQDASKDWQPFDPVVNTLIERARLRQRPMAFFTFQKQQYVIVFDTGGGASGAAPVVLRPTRYPQILQCMEDDIVQDITQRAQRLCEAHNVYQWTPFEANVDQVAQHFPASAVQQAVACIQDAQNIRERVATRSQLYMPRLLEKYKECDIRQVVSDTPPPQTRLDRCVEATLRTGLCVPDHINASWRQLVAFIHKHRSTRLQHGEPFECMLCQERRPLLGGHCGEARACLTCWSTTLAQRNMQCPFCNREVLQGQLRLCLQTPKVDSVPTRVAQPAPVQKDMDTIRQHLLTHWPTLDLSKSLRMEQWYRKLLQCNVISLHQRPKHSQKKKTFIDALKEFQLV